MGDYVSIQLGMRLKSDAPAGISDMVREILSPQHGGNGDNASLVSLTGRITIRTPEIPDGVSEVAVIDGMLYVDAFTSNTQRMQENGRSELASFLDLLDTYGDEPLGTVVGSLSGDWSFSDAGPLIVGGAGVTILDSYHDSLSDDGWWTTLPDPVKLSAISPVVAARLLRDNSSGWGTYADADIDEIVAWAATQPTS